MEIPMLLYYSHYRFYFFMCFIDSLHKFDLFFKNIYFKQISKDLVDI